MGRGSGEQNAAPLAAARAGDPVVAGVIEQLRAGVSDRKQRERFQHDGLLVAVERATHGIGAYGGRYSGAGPRYLPTALAQIMIDKGRLPTETEIKRTIKLLDTQLRRSGVNSDVTSGGYSYDQPNSPVARAEQQRLIRDRQSVKNFLAARARGQFEAVRIHSAGARGAQARLAGWLDELAQSSNYIAERLREQESVIRSGQFSVAEAEAAINSTGPSMPGEREEVTVGREAIRLGLGLRSSRQRLVDERESYRRAASAKLDRIHAGEKLSDGEIEWSTTRVADARVRRAAFGYCEAAARIQADYYQRALIELHDGTIDEVDVKRAHSDLEPYVREVVEGAAYHTAALAEAEALEQKAKKLLRRWARSS